MAGWETRQLIAYGNKTFGCPESRLGIKSVFYFFLTFFLTWKGWGDVNDVLLVRCGSGVAKSKSTVRLWHELCRSQVSVLADARTFHVSVPQSIFAPDLSSSKTSSAESRHRLTTSKKTLFLEFSPRLRATTCPFFRTATPGGVYRQWGEDLG